MATPPASNNPSGRQPSLEVLMALYNHLPALVLHVDTDGVVLHCNAETLRVTGYAGLVGKNLWATLFPGRLFAQVPKFIAAQSPIPPAPLRDVPMTIRTKAGKERIVAWTRFVHTEAGAAARRTIVLIGLDLTDRLLEADKESAKAAVHGPPDQEAGGFGANVGNGGTVEGEFVKPLAVIPPAPGKQTTGPSPAEQAHEYLGMVDARMEALLRAWAHGNMLALTAILERLRGGVPPGGVMPYVAYADRLQINTTSESLGPVNALVHDIAAMCRMERRPH